MNKRIFITTILPDNLLAKHKVSFAGANFSENLISGNGFDKVYSIMPTFVHGKIDINEATNYELIYSRIRESKFAKYATFFEQLTLFRKIQNGSKVWLYNIGYLNFLLFILIRSFKRNVKLYIIELDFVPPSQKVCPSSLFLYLLNHSDGVIKLANSELFTNKNSISLAGVTPKFKIQYPLIKNPEKSFLISGSLDVNISNINVLLETFAQLPDCTLHITGHADKVINIQEYCSKYKNIIYHGILTKQEYISLLHKITFQLSTRNPNYPDNSCNFPSKIIESLLHNRIVISTINYPQLNGIKYFNVSYDKKAFKEDIKSIIDLPNDKLLNYANQSDIIYSKFNPENWNKSFQVIESHEI